jgi:hypothetical protein
MSKLAARQEAAAIELAEDKLTDEAIAKRAGVSRAALAKWKAKPEFQERVEAAREQLAREAMESAVSRREHRLGVLNDLHKRLLGVIAQRETDPELAKVPGGATGLLTRRNAGGEREYPFDAALVDRLLATLKQGAQEAGQWSERRELSGPNGSSLAPPPPPILNVVFVDPEDVQGEE